mmetsp:Transcript_90500/g.156875  ORF Transcript_90500/g.156875 Transcript_90500/m.156875 type:complete len:212 (-) Transcript_90500:2694-3329(-)
MSSSSSCPPRPFATMWKEASRSSSKQRRWQLWSRARRRPRRRPLASAARARSSAPSSPSTSGRQLAESSHDRARAAFESARRPRTRSSSAQATGSSQRSGALCQQAEGPPTHTRSRSTTIHSSPLCTTTWLSQRRSMGICLLLLAFPRPLWPSGLTDLAAWNRFQSQSHIRKCTHCEWTTACSMTLSQTPSFWSLHIRRSFCTTSSKPCSW